MKKIYKQIALYMLAGCVALPAFAQQKNDEMVREVIMLREFNPTLNDAEKINLEPSIYAIPKKTTKPFFVENAPVVQLTSRQVGFIPSGNFNTNVSYDNQIGYFGFGAGNYGNLDGRGGVKLKAGENGTFDFWGTYLGANGNIKYVDNDVMPMLKDKNKAKLRDLDLHALYTLNSLANTFSLGIDFRNLGFNYYGLPVGYNLSNTHLPQTNQEKENFWNMFDFDTMQSINIMRAYANLSSNKLAPNSLFRYTGQFGFTAFTTKHGYTPQTDKGPNGGILNAKANIARSLFDGYIGVEGSVLYQIFNSKEKYTPTGIEPKDAFPNYLNLHANPYYMMEGVNWKLNLGANADFMNSMGENKILITPHITSEIHINEVNTLYLNILGGINHNTFTNMVNENKYVSMAQSMQYSKTPYDLQAGFKTGAITGMEIEIFGGYKQKKNAHYFASIGSVGAKFDEENIVTTSQKFWSNVGLPQYYKSLNTGNFGAQVTTQLIPMTNIILRGTGYFYSAKDDKEIYGRPTFEAMITADIKPIDPMTISITYLLQTGRKACMQSSYSLSNLSSSNYELDNVLKEYKMNNVNEFNVSAQYNIWKAISVYAGVYNLLNQKYEIQPGYALQGINFTGGVNIKF